MKKNIPRESKIVTYEMISQNIILAMNQLYSGVFPDREERNFLIQSGNSYRQKRNDKNECCKVAS